MFVLVICGEKIESNNLRSKLNFLPSILFFLNYYSLFVTVGVVVATVLVPSFQISVVFFEIFSLYSYVSSSFHIVAFPCRLGKGGDG